MIDSERQIRLVSRLTRMTVEGHLQWKPEQLDQIAAIDPYGDVYVTYMNGVRFVIGLGAPHIELDRQFKGSVQKAFTFLCVADMDENGQPRHIHDVITDTQRTYGVDNLYRSVVRKFTNLEQKIDQIISGDMQFEHRPKSG